MSLLRVFWVWFVAVRPWCYSTSFVPLIFGSVLAWVNGYPPRWDMFVLIMAAGVFLHTGVNYLNTYGDFVSGVDTLESADSDLTLSGQPERLAGSAFRRFGPSGGLYLHHRPAAL